MLDRPALGCLLPAVTLCHSGVTLVAFHPTERAAAVQAGALPHSLSPSNRADSMFRTLHNPAHGAHAAVTLHIDGMAVSAQPGETVAAVMLRQPEPWTRETPVSGARRAPYCMMGVCFDCLAEVDGQPSTQTCLTPVRDGMQVRRQRGRPNLLAPDLLAPDLPA